uniref:Acyl-CoA-binding domain-containing protein 6 n=1 Tax=Plectus sambesii TaxID=2011161 RepID=A0A914X6V8_9BILA
MFVVWLSRQAQSLLGRNTANRNIDAVEDVESDNEEVDDELLRQFESAAEHLQSVASELDADTLLYLYARFKRATEGPCTGQNRPSVFDPKGRKKFDAWMGVGRMSRERAMSEYIDRIVAANCGWDPQKTASRRQGFGLKPSRPALIDEDDSSSPPDNALLAAVKSGDVAEIGAVMEAHPELLTTRDDAGMTALHWAADHGNEAAVALLLANAHCPIDAQESSGQTALHYAASCGHSAIVELLLKANADRAIKDSDGLTAAQVTDCPTILLLLSAEWH